MRNIDLEQFAELMRNSFDGNITFKGKVTAYRDLNIRSSFYLASGNFSLAANRSSDGAIHYFLDSTDSDSKFSFLSRKNEEIKVYYAGTRQFSSVILPADFSENSRVVIEGPDNIIY